VEVVDDNLIKAEMRVNDEGHSEQAIKNRVGRRREDEGRDSKGDKCGGEEALKCPVMRAVRFGRGREGRGIVYGAEKDGASWDVGGSVVAGRGRFGHMIGAARVESSGCKGQRPVTVGRSEPAECLGSHGRHDVELQ